MNSRTRAKSVSSALANLSKSNSLRRSQSATMDVAPRSLRIVVLGLGGVGKTAMIVRFVTKRFIGDYDPTLETIYRHTAMVDEQLVNFEIMDTAGQGEKSLLLEDKCKWGESFVFVYDVTDRYSFDELTRLKFIASYTHSRLRVNFTPCWILIGNKADLAERDRMVTVEEGRTLQKELGCHIFREISVKESNTESGEIFKDLWREFSRMSPRSPSSTLRRKFSIRIQDKISTVDSHSSNCKSESNKQPSSAVSSFTNSLRRQASYPTILLGTKPSSYTNDANNNQERVESYRNCPCIPEHAEAEPKEMMEKQHRTNLRAKLRRNATIPDQQLENKSISFPLFSKRKNLNKSMSFDNVFQNMVPVSPSGTGTPLTSSSRSSSSSSLNGCGTPATSYGINMKTNINSHKSDSTNKQQEEDPETHYRELYCRNRSRRNGIGRYPFPVSPTSV